MRALHREVVRMELSFQVFHSAFVTHEETVGREMKRTLREFDDAIEHVRLQKRFVGRAIREVMRTGVYTLVIKYVYGTHRSFSAYRVDFQCQDFSRGGEPSNGLAT